jgi:hypothetical protein
VVIGKARRETRFAARAVRIDSTVVGADIRDPTDGVLGLQGARALAREGCRLAGRLRGPTVRVVDRSRRIGKLVRAISKRHCCIERSPRPTASTSPLKTTDHRHGRVVRALLGGLP